MTKDQKNEVIGLLKEKFGQYNNFYITDTESLTVAQVGTLRRHCFDKKVEMKVAKNTLIRKALEGIDAERYTGVYDALNNVTALMFSENPKDPALILANFRKKSNGDKPVLKAAFINGDIYVGDDQLKALTLIKTKDELIGDVIGLLQSPAKRVIAALLNNAENPASPNPSKGGGQEAAPVVAEVVAEAAPVAEAVEAAPVVEAVEAAPVVEVAPEAPAADATPEAPAEA
jgi:large subunit ribosomal protein L10